VLASGFYFREFLSQHPRRSSFDLLNQAVDSLLRSNFDQKVNMIGHNLPGRCFVWVTVAAEGYAQGVSRARQHGAHGEAIRPVYNPVFGHGALCFALNVAITAT